MFRFFPALGVCVLFTLSLAACQDSAHQPLALAVAPETHGAVLLTQDLPSLPILLAREGLEEDAAVEAEAWWESWGLSEDEGRRLRSRIYPSAARHLFPVLGEAGLDALLARHEETLRAVEAVGALFLPGESVRDGVQEARELHRAALAAQERGEGEKALEHAFSSVDALRALSPDRVAEDLVHRALEAFGRIQGAPSYSAQELTRIRRLTLGAQEALEEGDYPQAIRRAYYACQLLGADSS